MDISHLDRRSASRSAHLLDSSPRSPLPPSLVTASSQPLTPGRALIVRLMHIATLVRLPLPANAPPPPPPLLQLMRSALERVTALLKESTWDVQTYTQAITLLDAIDSIERRSQAGMDVDTPSGGAGTGSGADMDWVETARENEKKESAKLDVELRGYMSNLIKESIRVGDVSSSRLL
jgi:COP9 signalosome complex subunit 1